MRSIPPKLIPIIILDRRPHLAQNLRPVPRARCGVYDPVRWG